ncbi:MAG: hypothetical protein GY798_17785 [Hyphomicrobiales bacterium]|nr:hypothetical protein [Hyphomicrobiales bacterium]
MKIFRATDTPLDDQTIADWLRAMRGHPFVPESGFDVTSVFRTGVGETENLYFAGVNVENPDHRVSTHGEEACIAAMVTSLGNQAEIREGWIMGAPRSLSEGTENEMGDVQLTCCGKCRQQLANFANESVPIHSISLNGAKTTTTMGAFLPDQFTFQQFNMKLGGAGPATPRKAPTARQIEEKLVRSGRTLSQDEVFDWLRSLESADFATWTSDAVVIRLGNGAYVAGVKIEEAAFVDINAMQSATAIATGEFGKQEISEVWSFTTGRDKQQFDGDAFHPPSLSSVQTLLQFAAHREIPIHLLNAEGKRRDIKLADAATYAPTFAQLNATARSQELFTAAGE